MSVHGAYLAVVIIWSTTPLGIVWSSESVSPTLAVLMRMVIAVVLGGLLIKFGKIHLPWHNKAKRVYCYSGLGIYGGMLFSYLAASSVPSGMMSLMFGLSPIISGILGQKILNERKFGLARQCALMIALIGLALACSDNLSIDSQNGMGLILILLAVFFFSLSGVLVKSVHLEIHLEIHPVATTFGALSVCVPLFFFTWLITDGTLPVEQWHARSIWAILYLGVFGSLIGFVAYFYVLQKLSVSTTALITMMTPVFALILGSVLNNEIISIRLMIGAVLIMLGLFFYHFGEKFLLNRAKMKAIK
ncbi:MAG: DMT family transporter [Alteromonadaceae bacterium]|nr:DMT family transporter [Alteromonadaceae bacterium]